VTTVTDIAFKPCRFGDGSPAQAELITDENVISALRDVADMHKVLGGSLAVVMQRNAHKNIFSPKYKTWWQTLCTSRGQCVVDTLFKLGVPKDSMEIRLLDADSDAVYVEFLGDGDTEKSNLNVSQGRAMRMDGSLKSRGSLGSNSSRRDRVIGFAIPEERSASPGLVRAQVETCVSTQPCSARGQNCVRSMPARTVKIAAEPKLPQTHTRPSTISRSSISYSQKVTPSLRLTKIIDKFDHLLQTSVMDATPSTALPSPASSSMSPATSRGDSAGTDFMSFSSPLPSAARVLSH